MTDLPPRSRFASMAGTVWRQFTIRQWAGGFAAAMAFALTLLIAFLGSGRQPPSRASLVVLALVAGLLQLAAAGLFAGHGRADPTLAQSSTRGLLRTAYRAAILTAALERLYEGEVPVEQLQGFAGRMSVEASHVEEGIIEAIDDWRLFHPEAVAKAEEAMQSNANE